MKHRSSTCSPTWRYQSDTSWPELPYRFQVRRQPNTGFSLTAIGVKTRFTVGGSGCPANLSTAGLWSKVSMWLGPPSMNKKMTFLARGTDCAGLLDKGDVD